MILCQRYERMSGMLAGYTTAGNAVSGTEQRKSYNAVKDALREYVKVGQRDLLRAAQPPHHMALQELAGVTFHDSEQDRSRFVLPYTGDMTDEDVNSLPIMGGVHGVMSWAAVPTLARDAAFTVEFWRLRRGSMVVEFVDVFTGELVNGYGYQFIVMHERLYRAARLVHGDDFTARRRLIGRMLLIGSLVRRKWNVEELVLVAQLNVSLELLAEMVRGGELATYLAAGVAWDYIALLTGAAV